MPDKAVRWRRSRSSSASHGQTTGVIPAPAFDVLWAGGRPILAQPSAPAGSCQDRPASAELVSCPEWSGDLALICTFCLGPQVARRNGRHIRSHTCPAVAASCALDCSQPARCRCTRSRTRSQPAREAGAGTHSTTPARRLTARGGKRRVKAGRAAADRRRHSARKVALQREHVVRTADPRTAWGYRRDAGRTQDLAQAESLAVQQERGAVNTSRDNRRDSDADHTSSKHRQDRTPRLDVAHRDAGQHQVRLKERTNEAILTQVSSIGLQARNRHDVAGDDQHISGEVALWTSSCRLTSGGRGRRREANTSGNENEQDHERGQHNRVEPTEGVARIRTSAALWIGPCARRPPTRRQDDPYCVRPAAPVPDHLAGQALEAESWR